MPSHVAVTNFTSGVLSEKLSGQLNIEAYFNGASCLQNWIVQPQGGAASRAGTLFVAKTKHADSKAARLQKFEYSTTKAYMLEVGDKYIRFFTDRVLLRHATVKPDVALARSTSGSTTTISVASESPNMTLALSAATGQSVTATSGAALWSTTDVGRTLIENAGAATGRAYITEYVSTTVVKVDIYEPFADITLAAGGADWYIGGFLGTTHDYGRIVTTDTGGNAMILTANSNGVSAVVSVRRFSSWAASTASGAWQLTGPAVEVTTTYEAADVFELRFAQVADTVYIAHQDYAPRKLTRTTATRFAFSQVVFDPPTTYEAGLTIDTAVNALTLSTVAVGPVTITATNATFLLSDVGRTFAFGTGRSNITGFTSTQVVTGETLDAYESTALTAGTATVGLSPIAKLRLQVKGPRNTHTNLKLFAPTATDAQITADSAGQIEGWRPNDVGRLIIGGNGIVRITSVADARTAAGTILKPFEDVHATSTADTGPWSLVGGNWTLEDAAWSVTRGFPGVVAFGEQRSFWAGTASQPDSFWGSVSADFENMGRGSNADDALDQRLGSGNVNLIRWMTFLDKMLIGTVGSEHIAYGGGNDEPITPETIRIKRQAVLGSDYTVDAIAADNVAVFVQRGARKLRELGYDLNTDSWQPNDFALISEHLFSAGISQTAYCRTPDSIILAVRKDGALLAGTYERRQKILAWTEQITGPAQDFSDGQFKSVDAMPNSCGTSDEVWVIVRRKINLAWTQYVEVFDGQLSVDCASVYMGAPSDNISGVEALANEAVKVVSPKDSRVYGATVSSLTTIASGLVSSTSDALGLAHIGLLFVPHLRTVRPEWNTQSGPAAGRRKHITEVIVRLYCTRIAVAGTGRDGPGLYLNNEVIEFPVDATSGAAFSGDIRKSGNLGWDRDGRVTLRQTNPLPCTVTLVVKNIQVAND